MFQEETDAMDEFCETKIKIEGEDCEPNQIFFQIKEEPEDEVIVEESTSYQYESEDDPFNSPPSPSSNIIKVLNTIFSKSGSSGGQSNSQTPMKKNVPLMKGVNGSQSYTCHICKKSWKFKSLLERHVRRHGVFPVIECNLCPYKTKFREQLRTHIMNDHKKEAQISLEQNYVKIPKKVAPPPKPTASESEEADKKGGKSKKNHRFSCDVCYRSFQFKSLLIRHARQHAEERPFTCDICSFKFKFKEHLRSHIKTHMKETRFDCPLCEKKFYFSSQLKQHIPVHLMKKSS